MKEVTTMPPKLSEIDLTESELYRNGFPHDVFSVLRSEAPVWRHPETKGFKETGGEGFWVLSKYADIREANREETLTIKPNLGRRGDILDLEKMAVKRNIQQETPAGTKIVNFLTG